MQALLLGHYWVKFLRPWIKSVAVKQACSFVKPTLFFHNWCDNHTVSYRFLRQKLRVLLCPI